MYKDMNDYEILYMVCDEKEDIFDILIEKYKPLIYKIVKDYIKFFKKLGYELEDLMQLGYITLYKTSLRYDINNQTMFYTYFKKSLTNTIITTLKNNTSSKKEVLNNALSYDIELPNSKLRYIDIIPSNKTIINLDKELIIFKNSMPITLSYIFELFYNGYNKEEISLLLDESLEDIKNSFSKIKQHALTYKSLFFA